MDKGIWNKLDDVYEVLKALRASYPNRIKIIKDLLDEALFRPGFEDDFIPPKHVNCRCTFDELKQSLKNDMAGGIKLSKGPPTTVSVKIEVDADKAIEQLTTLNNIAGQFSERLEQMGVEANTKALVDLIDVLAASTNMTFRKELCAIRDKLVG